jgi:hypothetical protein
MISAIEAFYAFLQPTITTVPLLPVNVSTGSAAAKISVRIEPRMRFDASVYAERSFPFPVKNSRKTLGVANK